MSVDLGGLETGVTKQLLDDPEVGAPVEKMGSEGVAESMGVRGHHRPAIEDAPDVAGAEPLARAGCRRGPRAGSSSVIIASRGPS